MALPSPARKDYHGESWWSTVALPDLRAWMSVARRRHAAGTVTAAVELAGRFGADPSGAALAGHYHDLARDLPPADLLALATRFGLFVDPVSRRAPTVLHGQVAAEVAREQFGVTAPEVLGAIAWHTTGIPRPRLLEKILFVADAIEPGRSYPGLDEIRAAAGRDLDEAMLLAVDSKLIYLVAGGRLVHPRLLAARNSLLLNVVRPGPTSSGTDSVGGTRD